MGKKEKFELKLYVAQFEDGSYLVFNTEADEIVDMFKSTKKLSEATLLNRELKERLEEVLEDRNRYFYVEEDREFKKVKEIIGYGLYRLS